MLQKAYNEMLRLFQNNETPSLVFDRSIILSNLQALKDLARKNGINVLSAVKSMPDREMLGLMANDLDGFDISNLEELNLVPRDSMDNTLFFTNPSLSTMDLRAILALKNSVVTVDNSNQLRMLAEIEVPVRFVLRVNSSLVLGEETPSRFGFDPKELNYLIDDLKGMLRKHIFSGFHFHHGSEKNTSQDYIRMAEMALTLSRQLGLPLELLNLGGGLHQIALEHIPEFFSRLRSLVPPGIKILFEPGRLLGVGAGFGLSRITSFKKVNELEYYTLDISRVCHFGWSTPQLFYTRREGNGSAVCRLFGPTCYEGDYLGEYNVPVNTTFPSLPPDSPVIFSNISTYSMALNRSFNGIPYARINWI